MRCQPPELPPAELPPAELLPAVFVRPAFAPPAVPKLLRPANRVLALVRGIPAVFTDRSDMRMLCAPGVTGIRP
jgi:hypothetical protein